MPRMNCTIRKTKNASVASSFGTISGSGVSIQPRNLNSTNCGTISTWCGSSSVAIMTANHMPAQRKAQPGEGVRGHQTGDAVGDDDTARRSRVLLRKNRAKLTVCMPVQPRT